MVALKSMDFRIEYTAKNAWFPSCIPSNEKLCSLVISKTELKCSISQFLHMIGLSILLHLNMWTEYINSSQTHEGRNWDWGRTIPFLGTVYRSEVELERKGLKLKIMRCYPLKGTVSTDENGQKYSLKSFVQHLRWAGAVGCSGWQPRPLSLLLSPWSGVRPTPKPWRIRLPGRWRPIHCPSRDCKRIK